MSMRVEPEYRRVLAMLTAIVLLVAMAATGTIFLLTMSTDVEFGIMVALFDLLFLLFPLSPYVFLFLCRWWMVTESQASGLLWGSVAISGFGVLMLWWILVVHSVGALSALWFLIIPVPQWIACVILVACIRYFTRSLSEEDVPGRTPPVKGG
jgi:hypothetical protein